MGSTQLWSLAISGANQNDLVLLLIKLGNPVGMSTVSRKSRIMNHKLLTLNETYAKLKLKLIIGYKMSTNCL